MNNSTLRLLAAFLLCGALGASAMDDAPAPSVDKTYQDAKTRYQTNSSDDTIVREYASACFDCADNAANDSRRATMSQEGIEVCRAWLLREPQNGVAHYYLAMNLAQLARTKTLGALSIVKEMEKEWLATLSFDANCDYAGADRNLGLLYRDAPGFPISIGSKSKAAEHLQSAIQLAPEYPENWLNLLETDIKHKPSAVPEEIGKLKAILPNARKQFSGPQWKSSWADWDPRIKTIEAKAANLQ